MSLTEVRGIGPKGAEKLIAAGINTPDELSVQRPEEIQSILVCSLKQAKETIQYAKDLMYQSVEILDGEQYDKWSKSTTRFISTGSSQLDSILGGGWKSRSTHGAFGEFSTGKSQLANTATVNAIDEGFDVCLVETESNTFELDRLKQIASSRGLKFDGSKIHLYPATQVGTVYAQFRGYEYLWKKAIEKNWDVGLMIVDSFNAKFRRAFAGRENFPKRSEEFGRHIDYLEEFAKKFNSAVFLTFQVGVTPEGGGQQGDQMRYNIEHYPVGGTLVQHNINTWISVNQVKGGIKSANVYEAHLVDSSYRPKATCQFQLTDKGVEDF